MLQYAPQDGQLYYQRWFPLLDFVNRKYGVKKHLKKMEGAEFLEPNEVKTVSDKLFDHVSLIDEYLLKQEDIPASHREIILGWKRCVRGRFIIERHLKKGSIFISMEDESINQVVGIISSIEEMFAYAPMPLMVEATLIPFGDVIITDGLIMPYNVVLGRNMAKDLKDTYMYRAERIIMLS